MGQELPGLEPLVQVGGSPQEPAPPASGWQGSVAVSGSEARRAWPGRVGREQSSRCWPSCRPSKCRWGYFSLQTCLATRHRSKEKAESVLSILGLKLTPLFFPLPRPSPKPQVIKSSMWDLLESLCPICRNAERECQPSWQGPSPGPLSAPGQTRSSLGAAGSTAKEQLCSISAPAAAFATGPSRSR